MGLTFAAVTQGLVESRQPNMSVRCLESSGRLEGEKAEDRP